jgi:hypothetical protein
VPERWHLLPTKNQGRERCTLMPRARGPGRCRLLSVELARAGFGTMSVGIENIPTPPNLFESLASVGSVANVASCLRRYGTSVSSFPYRGRANCCSSYTSYKGCEFTRETSVGKLSDPALGPRDPPPGGLHATFPSPKSTLPGLSSLSLAVDRERFRGSGGQSPRRPRGTLNPRT